MAEHIGPPKNLARHEARLAMIRASVAAGIPILMIADALYIAPSKVEAMLAGHVRKHSSRKGQVNLKTEQLRPRVLALAAAGRTTNAIGRETGLAAQTVQRILGIPSVPGKKRGAATPYEIQSAIARAYAEGDGPVAIANRFHISAASVSKIRLRYHVPARRPIGVAPKASGDEYAVRNQRIIAMRRAGHALATIGRNFKLTRERVRQILKAHAAGPNTQALRPVSQR